MNDWFTHFQTTPEYQKLKDNPVAYFCAEFAISPGFPTYAGGLGVLAGDYIHQAAENEIPLVCVGMYYHEGYARPRSTISQGVLTSHRQIRPEDTDLHPVVDSKGQRVIVTVPIQDHDVKVQAWSWRKNAVTVYFLDTDIPDNTPSDQHITDSLYNADKEIRLKQEMVLGIGGIRLLHALDIHPSIYHANEGHSAFLAFELAKHEMTHRKVDFARGCEYAKEHIVFTNHTLVAAGNELFSNDLVSAMLSRYAEELQIPVANLISLGLVQDSSLYSMTMLSLRMSSKANAVSKLHAQKAAEIWKDHPMSAVTNGIYIRRWDKIISNNIANLWSRHQQNKKQFLNYISTTTGKNWSENTLLLGWARRIATYKRPLALVENIHKFLSLANNQGHPVRVVFSGIPHGYDTDGLQMLATLQEVISTQLRDVAVFLPNYGLEVAQLMAAGCDIWLNTPVVGFEASGTSGMKAALNGCLPLTTKDGWVHEVELFKIGWIVDSSKLADDVLQALEKDIIPMYYSHVANPTNSDWLEHMKNARELILHEFSMSRVLKEYIEKLYLPSLSSAHPSA